MSGKIIEYYTAFGLINTDASLSLSLDLIVNSGIEDGFEPYGPPFLLDNEYVCQAMVKYED